MNRIAAGVLIVVAILAINGIFLRDSFAGELPKPAIERAPDARDLGEIREGSRILALLVALQALRPAPAGSGSSKS
jgi:hypothetical protein